MGHMCERLSHLPLSGIHARKWLYSTEMAYTKLPVPARPSSPLTEAGLALTHVLAESDIPDIIQRESNLPILQDLLLTAFRARPNHDLDLISRAYHFAELALRGQLRKSGDPSITHAAAVSQILIDLNLDSSTIAAGLLHDVVEDTAVPVSQISAEFGEEISILVDGVTRIKDLTFQTPEDEQAENFRKMLLSMARDIRVVLIKFADRLHNLRTLKYLTPEIQERMVLESRDIYAPLAHRLGISRIRSELEDLSLKWLDPDAYREIQEKINLTREEREAYIEEVHAPLKEALRNTGIEAEITGRSKNFYSIYRKMVVRGKSFTEIYDLLAIRILVETLPECYNALGLVHSMYTPVMARFKDFIATPKSNMYQSLHTTVVGPKGMMLEVQIRTNEMHHTAEVGIAAHWRYKEGRKSQSDLDQHMAWLRGLVEWQSETTDPKEFMEELKVDLFPTEIYVFTPRGDLIRLPENATPIDFAFAVHTDVGLHCTGAHVNEKMVPLSSSLETGCTVEVITSPHQHPSRDWLSVVKSAKARSRIRKWLREEEHTHSVRLGQEIVERELKRRRRKAKTEAMEEAARNLGVDSVEHLYAGIGNGEFSLSKLIYELFPSAKPAPKKTRAQKAAPGSETPLKIHGLKNLMIHFAKCCRPIPGDPILGIITKGKGVSVHRRNCTNVLSLTQDSERVIAIDWDTEKESFFSLQVQVNGLDRPNFLRDVSQAFSDLGIPILDGKLNTANGEVGDLFTVQVKSTDQFSGLRQKVLTVSGVTSVERIDEAPD